MPKIAAGSKIETSGSIIASVPETSFARLFARSLTPWLIVLILGAAIALGSFIYGGVARSFEPELAARTMDLALSGFIINRMPTNQASPGFNHFVMASTQDFP